MKPGTKAELAINALVDLANRKPAAPLALALLAKKQSISLSYLEQIFAALRRNGLVDSVRGPGGGYQLARSADRITTGEIIAAVESDGSDLSFDLWTAHPLVEKGNDLHAFWNFVDGQVLQIYHDICLQDILDGTYLDQDQKS